MSFARPGGVYSKKYQTSVHRELMTEEVRQSLQRKMTNSTKREALGKSAHSSLDSEGPVSSRGRRKLHCFLGDHGATQYENIRSRMQIDTPPPHIQWYAEAIGSCCQTKVKNNRVLIVAWFPNGLVLVLGFFPHSIVWSDLMIWGPVTKSAPSFQELSKMN